MIDDVQEITDKKESICYNGNIKLLRDGVEIGMTETQKHELKKIAADATYFAKNYVKIVTLDDGVQLFNVRDYQQEFIKTCFSQRFVMSMMARQMGKTTTVVAYLLHQAITRPHIRIGVLANKGDTAKEVLERIKFAYQELPFYMQVGVKSWNKNSIELGNGTVIIAAATSSDSIRGKSMHIIYLDEFAHVENDEEFYTSTYPVISSGKTSQVLITSTPKGMNLFYKLWTDAQEKRNSFVPLLYTWQSNPDVYDEKWYNETRLNIPAQRFAQEYGCEFLGSAATLLSGDALRKLAFVDPIEHESNRHFKFYEMPKENHNYVATVDVCEGVGNDFSIITVFDVTETPYKIAAKYRNSTIQPVSFTDVIFKLCTAYNKAHVWVESNSIGNGVVSDLFYDYEYENIICYSLKTGFRFDYKNLGVRTTPRTKSIGCSTLKTLIESGILIVQDFDAITELSTFTLQGKSYKADKDKHDDVVMSLVFFAFLSQSDYFKEIFEVDTNRAMRQQYDIFKDEPLFMIVVNGLDDDDSSDTVMYR